MWKERRMNFVKIERFKKLIRLIFLVKKGGKFEEKSEDKKTVKEKVQHDWIKV